METKASTGDHYKRKGVSADDDVFKGGVTIIQAAFGLVFVRQDSDNRGFWLSEKELFEKYEYTHYIPTHQEMG
jgi:hypothetical protein